MNPQNPKPRPNNKILEVLSFTADKTKELACANSIVGQPIEKDGFTIIPISKVSAGFAGGGADINDSRKQKRPAGAGANISVTPVSFLILYGSEVRVIQVDQEPDESKSGGLDWILQQIKPLFKKGNKE